MPDILIATTNSGKIREISLLLSSEIDNLRLFSPKDLNIKIVPKEDGTTFLENSTLKSLFYSKQRKDILTLADDSGLTVDSLNGSPGIRSARYGGECSNDSMNIKKLLNDLHGKNNRKAKFVSVLTLAMNGVIINSFKGEVEGEIINEPRGNNGFGYDPVFYYEPLKKTFAELSKHEKNQISHRSKALKKMKEFIISNKDFLSNSFLIQ